MGRGAGDGHAKPQRSCLHRGDPQIGRLDDDGGVGAMTAQERSQRPGTPVLFPGRGDDHHRPGDLRTRLLYRPHRSERGDESSFHVAGAAPEDEPVAQGGAPWIAAPPLRIPGRDDVDVAVEHQCGPGTVRPPDHAQEGIAGDLCGVVGVGADLVEIDFPFIDRHADVRQRLRHPALCRGLLAGHAGNGDQLLEHGHQPGLVDRLQDRLLATGQFRHTGRVRHVAPPSALCVISVPE